jgi:aconitate hydratase
LQKTELLKPLETLGFHVVGYGCTTCIGNSGPLPEPVVEAIDDGSLVVASVLSGNRNFEGRISPHIKANYLASPPLVVAYAIAGTVNIDLNSEPLGVDAQGNNVFLKDIWPSNEEIGALLDQALDPENFIKRYSDVESSNSRWNAVPLSGDAVYEWREESSYIQEPPFFVDMAADVAPIKAVKDARVLVKVGDSVTTDHISPAGAIAADGPAGRYLQERGVVQKDFNSYGSRRGNDRVMTRGTFANIRLRNQLAPGTEGGWTTDYTTGQQSSIFDAAANYQAAGIPTVVLAGKDYGMGSSRDWAAKGTYLLGVAAVIAESFERIHRSNLVGMGVLPLQLNEGDTWKSLGLEGTETLQIAIDDSLKPRQQVDVVARSKNGKEVKFQTVCRIDTPIEVDYYRNGGILHTVLRQMLAQ